MLYYAHSRGLPVQVGIEEEEGVKGSCKWKKGKEGKEGCKCKEGFADEAGAGRAKGATTPAGVGEVEGEMRPSEKYAIEDRGGRE